MVSYFFIMLLIINSSQIFLNNYQDEMLAFSTVVAMLGLYYYRRIPSLFFLFFVSLLLLWVGYIVIQYDVWNMTTAIGFLCRIFLAYSVVAILCDRFFPTLLDVVYKLAIISLPLYFIGLLFPFIMEQFHSMLNLMPDLFIIERGEYIGWLRANFMVYTFSVVRLGQNHGFMWEPTAFAGVLLFAIMIHLCMNNCQLDRKFKVLLITLLTTFSTTGFLAFSLVVAFILINGHANYKVIVGLAAIILLPYIFSLDFISDKVGLEIEQWDDISSINTSLTMSGNTRLSSFIYDMRDFDDHPLLGSGIFIENRYTGAQTQLSVNGVGNTLSRFGLILSIIFMINMALSFKRLSLDNHTRGHFLFVLLYITISWSETLTILPLFIAFQLYYMVYIVGFRSARTLAN